MELGSRLAVGLLLLALCSAQPVKFKDCGSTTGKIIIVDITPCPSLPCILRKGQSYAVNVTFASKTSSQRIVAAVFGIMSGIPIPFNVPNSDGCKSGIQCPIRNNQIYHYLNYLPVKMQYPSVKLVVEWELKDELDRDLFCWRIPVQISS
ncbi:NPC intracellular cholesterol transporter 2-like [Leucoraja erinacea]|uniref:NPC intracellular cholesterol transporter 2-like n=1 Tax=Leucoraja erinaceus TaxID=7782 RepID=UPI002455EC72|nr:NPC intracellular cholesterol transporter 2-like [Leucoraja erinacea]